MRNPFNPTFGRIPKVYLSRKKIAGRLAEELDDFDSQYLATLVYGARGTGKTTLLSAVSRELAGRKDWIVVDLPSAKWIVPKVAREVYEQSPTGLKVLLKIIAGVKTGLSGYRQPQQSSADAATQMEAIAKLLKARKIKLLITIDEVVPNPELAEFTANYQILIRHGYHIGLLLAGLPANITRLQNDRVLTFLFRSPRVELTPLDPLMINETYHRVFEKAGRTLTDEAATEMVRLVGGYAYAFQLVGSLIWETGATAVTIDTVNQVRRDFRATLFSNAYLKIKQELSARNIEFLMALADQPAGPVKIATLIDALKWSKETVNVYRARLIDAQVIRPVRWGYVAFALPLFRDFLEESGRFAFY